MPPGVIRAKTYQGIQVHELALDSKTLVMRRVKDGYVNATHILKVAGLEKAERTKILEKEIVLSSNFFEKVQGGYGKYQGTWVPLEEARILAQKYDAEAKIRTLLDMDVNAIGPFTIEESEFPVKGADASPAHAKSSKPAPRTAAASSSSPSPNAVEDAPAQILAPENAVVSLNVKGAMTRRRAKMGLEGIDPRDVAKQAATPARKRVRFPPGLIDPAPRKPTRIRVPQKLKAAAKRNQKRAAALKEEEEVDASKKASAKKAPQRGGKKKEETPPPPKRSLFEKRKELILNTIMDSKIEVNDIINLLMSRWPEPKLTPSIKVSLSKKQQSGTLLYPSSNLPITTPKKKRLSWRVALDKNGRTAGHYAARYGKWRIVRGLIQRNTTANITTFDGANYLMSAISHPSCRRQGCFKKMLEVIGNTYEHTDKKSRTVLHRLARASGDCRHERREAAVFYTECIISHFPKPHNAAWINAQDNDGRTALHLACQGGNRRMVELLIIELLADHTIQDLDGALAADLSSTWAVTEFLMRTGVIDMPKNPEIEAFMKRRMNPIVFFDEDDDDDESGLPDDPDAAVEDDDVDDDDVDDDDDDYEPDIHHVTSTPLLSTRKRQYEDDDAGSDALKRSSVKRARSDISMLVAAAAWITEEERSPGLRSPTPPLRIVTSFSDTTVTPELSPGSEPSPLSSGTDTGTLEITTSAASHALFPLPVTISDMIAPAASQVIDEKSSPIVPRTARSAFPATPTSQNYRVGLAPAVETADAADLTDYQRWLNFVNYVHQQSANAKSTDMKHGVRSAPTTPTKTPRRAVRASVKAPATAPRVRKAKSLAPKSSVSPPEHQGLDAMELDL